jgi:hypothetical protein
MRRNSQCSGPSRLPQFSLLDPLDSHAECGPQLGQSASPSRGSALDRRRGLLAERGSRCDEERGWPPETASRVLRAVHYIEDIRSDRCAPGPRPSHRTGGRDFRIQMKRLAPPTVLTAGGNGRHIAATHSTRLEGFHKMISDVSGTPGQRSRRCRCGPLRVLPKRTSVPAQCRTAPGRVA